MDFLSSKTGKKAADAVGRRLKTFSDVEKLQVGAPFDTKSSHVIFYPVKMKSVAGPLVLDVYGYMDRLFEVDVYGQFRSRIRVRPGSHSLALYHHAIQHLKSLWILSAAAAPVGASGLKESVGIGCKRTLPESAHWVSPISVARNGHMHVAAVPKKDMRKFKESIVDLTAFDLDGRQVHHDTLQIGMPVKVTIQIDTVYQWKNGTKAGVSVRCLSVSRVSVLSLLALTEFLDFIHRQELFSQTDPDMTAITLPSSTARGLWTIVYDYAVEDPAHHVITVPASNSEDDVYDYENTEASSAERLLRAWDHIADAQKRAAPTPAPDGKQWSEFTANMMKSDVTDPLKQLKRECHRVLECIRTDGSNRLDMQKVALAKILIYHAHTPILGEFLLETLPRFPNLVDTELVNSL